MTPEAFIIFKAQAIGTKVLKPFSNSESRDNESPQTGYCITCQSAKKSVKGFYDICSDTSKSAEKVKTSILLAAGFICMDRMFLEGRLSHSSSGKFYFSTREPRTILAGLDFHIHPLRLYFDNRCPLYSIYCALNEVAVPQRKQRVTEAQRQEGGFRFQSCLQALVFTSFFETLLLSFQSDNIVYFTE